jgi:hypothetical protein
MQTQKEKKALDYLFETHCADFCAEYGEPGYSNPEKGIIFANWKDIPKGLADWLEASGYSLEWSDEWHVSHEWGKAYRTSPDSYHWEPSIILPPEACEYLTPEDSPSDWIDALASDKPGQPLAPLPSSFDISALYAEGFEPYGETRESGLFPGQTDNPQELARHAFKFGADRVIVRKIENSQFYCKWELWAEMGQK